MIAAARAEFAKLGTSSALADLELLLVEAMSPPTVTVWSDAQGLVHEMSVGLQMNVNGSAVVGHVVVHFSRFGSPVLITAPSPSDTISYQSFLQSLGQ